MSTTPEPNRRDLVLIRHSVPDMDFSVPSSEWALSALGRRRCAEIAPQVGKYAPAMIYTGPEPKMRQTGRIIGRELNIPVEVFPGIQEHMRPVLPYRGPDEWNQLIARLFANPDYLVLGHETARECQARFADAVHRLAHRHTSESFAVVSGATAIALYVAQITGEPAYAFWKSLEMPDIRVVNHSFQR